jgi:Tfp pilus assembly protein PilF
VVCLALLSVCRAAAAVSNQASNPVLLAEVQLWQGHQYLDQGRTDLAADAFLNACELDKASPYPHFALARLNARRSPMDAFLEFGTGMKLAGADFPYQSHLTANALIIALVAAGAAIYVGVLVILVRHAKTTWYSILLTYAPLFGDKWLRLIMIAATGAFIVMLSGTSPLAMATWAIAIGCGLVWRFAVASERRMMIALGVFLVALIPLFDLTMRVVSTQHPDSPTRIASLERDTFRAGTAELAAAERLLSERDPVGQFMRGLVALKTGDYAGAAGHFTQAAALGGSSAAVLNNIGVAYHNLGRFREAEGKFEDALKLGPKEAVIHYNYSQTLNALLQYDRAQAELTKASSLDFELTRAMVTSRDRPTLIPMGLGTEVLWDMAMARRNKIVTSAYNPVESNWAGMLLLAGLAGAAYMLMRKSRLPARCNICEKIVRTQVAKRKRREVLCPECRAIKQVNADDNEALEKQIEQRLTALETRRSIASLVAGAIVPGSTYHLLGSKIKGILFSFAVFALLGVVVTRGGPMRQTPQLDVGTSTGWALIGLAVVYGLCVWRSVVLVLKTAEEE